MSKDFQYFKSLDTLRAIAVFLVIAYHWIPSKFIHASDLGGWGVNLFFVLSGFLITMILLQNKNQREITGLSKKSTIWTFYIRRAFRIFPIYYLTLIVVGVFSSKTNTSFESSSVYYLTYTTNIYYFFNQQWDGILSHLWSLAVEEQFYLFWPWIVIFVPKRVLPSVFVTVLLLSAVFKQVAYCFVDNDFVVFQTPACLDAFCCGAVLAYVIVNKQSVYEQYKRWLFVFAPISALLYVCMTIGIIPMFLPKTTLMSVISLFLISVSLNPKGFVFKTILENRILLFIGKISYGLYVFHNFIPWIRSNAFDYCYSHLNNQYVGLFFAKYNVVADFFLNLTMLFLVAVVSWFAIELPLIKQKDKFKYIRLSSK